MTDSELHTEMAASPGSAWMELDLSALENNYRVIRRRIGPNKKLVGVVKADAYGHGAVEIARVLSDLGVDALATGSLVDAVAIRKSCIRTRLLMLGAHAVESLPELLLHDLTPTINSIADAEAVSKVAARPTAVHVKVDCGFGRLGVPVEHALETIRRAAALPQIVIEGVYTHLPFSDAAGLAWARDRHGAFDGLVETLARTGTELSVTQAMSSSGVAAGLTDRCNAVACGTLLYGLAPVAPELADLTDYRTVLRAIKTRLVHVGRRPAVRRADEQAHYLGADVSVTGVIPVGLCDGYRSPAPGKKAFVLLAGRRVPVLRVCLENTILDLSGSDEAEIGAEVVILGRSGSEWVALVDIADWQGVSPLSVLMSFDRRMVFRYLRNPD